MSTGDTKEVPVIRRAIGQWGIRCPFCQAMHWHPRLGEAEATCGKGRYRVEDSAIHTTPNPRNVRKQRDNATR